MVKVDLYKSNGTRANRINQRLVFAVFSVFALTMLVMIRDSCKTTDAANATRGNSPSTTTPSIGASTVANNNADNRKNLALKYGLHVLKPIAQKDASKAFKKIRFSEESLRDYVDNTLATAEGWLMKEDLFMISFLQMTQHEMGMVGPVGEIGVHHGKLAVPIGMLATPEEKIWAADLFDNQEENIDKSGKGNYQIFKSNMDHFGIGSEQSTYIQAVNSLRLKHDDLIARNFAAFRFFSVDGGHTHDITLNDLAFASSIIMPGGIIALDDWFNKVWMGVTSALFDFIRMQDYIVPFYIGGNKIFLTTKDHVDTYVNSIRKYDARICLGAEKDRLLVAGSFPKTIECKIGCGGKDDPCKKMHQTDELVTLLESVLAA